MAYDEDLADRIRAVLGERDVGPVEEKKMFGGLAFMVRGKMAVATSSKGGLLVPVGPHQAAPLSAGHEHVEPMVMGASAPSHSWVRVAAVDDDADLVAWVDRGLAANVPPAG